MVKRPFITLFPRFFLRAPVARILSLTRDTQCLAFAERASLKSGSNGGKTIHSYATRHMHLLIF